MPMPTEAPSLASRIALDFTARQARHAKARSASTSSGAASPVASVHVDGSSPVGVHVVDALHQHAAADLAELHAGRGARRRAAPGSGCSSCAVRTSTAPSSYAGRHDHLGEDLGDLLGHRHRAPAGSTAITPPNADTGSHSWARRCASATSAPTAMPHGLACLMIATAGSVEVVRRPAGRVGVDVVVVGHLLAVQLLAPRRGRRRRAGRARPAGAGSRRSAAPPPCPTSRRSRPGTPSPRRCPSARCSSSSRPRRRTSRCARTPRRPAAAARRA